ncbi:ApaG domain-containing protein [Pseudomonas aeruginosa]|uniref:ApaG domain-containing protein n=1 Tax=Pseudomonas aeruginosa TaxID=287 RepID=UPI001D0BDCF6|nr:ApaG domain-containing protein [Pseudomonas aeruginosa]MCC0234070.1 ApaG domain-containing protein [Pseudomonas aeruginosa]
MCTGERLARQPGGGDWDRRTLVVRCACRVGQLLHIGPGAQHTYTSGTVLATRVASTVPLV